MLAIDRVMLVALAILLRAPGFAPSSLNHDEAFYMLVARELLAGYPPCATVIFDKPPGMPLLVALAMSLGGMPVPAVRALGTLCVMGTACLLYEILRSMRFHRVSCWAAGVLYIAMTTRLGGLSTNMELVETLLMAVAVLLVVSRRDDTELSRQFRAVAYLGIPIGLGIWLKFLPGLMGCSLFAFLVGGWIYRKQVKLVALPGLAVTYAVVCVAPTALGAWYHYTTGFWDAFWTCNVGLVVPYATAAVPGHPIQYALLGNGAVLLPIVLLATSGLAMWRRNTEAISLLLLWLLTEGIAVAAPMKFFDHYFQLVLPPLSLLAGIGASTMWETERWRRILFVTLFAIGAAIDATLWIAPRYFNLIGWLLTLLGVMCAIVTLRNWAERQQFFAQGNPGYRIRSWAVPSMIATLTVALVWPAWQTWSQPDPAREIAAKIRAEAPAGAKVWVINSEPVIYLLTGAPIPTRFAFPPALTSEFAVVAVQKAKEVQRILASAPTFLVVDTKPLFTMPPDVAAIIANEIGRNYRPLARSPKSEGELVLYRRRDTDP